jgi:competence protein ComEC
VTGVTRIPAPHLVVAGLCVGLCAALAVRIAHPLSAVAAAIVVLVAPFATARRAVLLAAALAAAGWWWGSVRLDDLDASVLAEHMGEAGLVELEVTAPPRRTEFAVRVPVRVRRFGRLDVDERARLDLPPGRAPPQGAILEVVATIARPRPAERGSSFDEAAYLERQGVHVVLRASGFRAVGRRGGIAGVADGLRATLAESMAPGVRGERRALIAGVVLGEDEGLTPSLRDDFRASGLYHLLAVSGQNVAYVVLGALLVAWIVGLPRWAGQVGALGGILGYVLAVGWQPSVVRAGIAGALASLAWISARPLDRWYFLLVGAAVLLAVNPYALLEPGFQLSFAAVSAIFVAVGRVERRLEGYPVPARLATVIAVSLVCGVATAPIVWIHFGAVPVFSVIANALAAPVVAPLLGLAFAAAAVGPVAPAAALALGWVNGWLAAYLAWCARAVGGLPHAQVESPAALAALALGILVVVIGLRIRTRRGPRLAALAAMAAAAALGWNGWPGAARGTPPPTGLRVTFLDVGQGDATLIQVPEGAVLVDQGPPEARVADQLTELGVRDLALLVMTHPSRDNIGGARDVIDKLEVGVVLDPQLAHDNPYGDPALAAARREGIRTNVARAGMTYRLGPLTVRVLWPKDRGSAGEDPNDSATVLLVSYGEVDMLLPADAESNVTLLLRAPPVEILKVAHHGSEDDGLTELLDVVDPEIAVVSVGAHNDYGHPAPSTVAALERFRGLEVYRTDKDGRVVVESDGARLIITEER